MPQYVIVSVEVTDAEMFKEYQSVGGPAVAKHGGKAIAGGPETQILQAAHDENKGVVLMFPDAKNVTDWLEDPELADVHDLRNKAANVTIISLPAMN